MDQIFREFGNTIADIFSSEIVQLALRGIGIYIVILWLATAFWAYQDMRSRTSNPILPFLAAALIVAFTPLLFIFAAIVYRIIRPHERVGEAHERMLAEEAMLAEVEQLDHCGGCGRRVADGWMVCPTCRTRLRRPCPSCGKLAGADWVVCAWCGVDFERQPGRPVAAAAAYGAQSVRPTRAQARPATAAPAAASAAAEYPPQPAYAPSQATYAPPAPAYAPADDVPGWPVAQPAASTAAPPISVATAADRTATSRTAPAAAAEPMPTVSQARRAEAATVASRPAPSPAPSPFVSTTPELDAEGLASLVSEPVAATAASPAVATAASPTAAGADEVVAKAPARVSGRRTAAR